MKDRLGLARSCVRASKVQQTGVKSTALGLLNIQRSGVLLSSIRAPEYLLLTAIRARPPPRTAF